MVFMHDYARSLINSRAVSLSSETSPEARRDGCIRRLEYNMLVKWPGNLVRIRRTTAGCCSILKRKRPILSRLHSLYRLDVRAHIKVWKEKALNWNKALIHIKDWNRSVWPTGFGTNSHSLLLNQRLLPSQWVPVLFSTYLLTQYMRIQFQDRHGAASLRYKNCAEITMFIFVNSSPIRYGFRVELSGIV